jgi:cell division protein FtsB
MPLQNKSFKALAHSQKKKHQLILAGMLFAICSLVFSFFFGEMGFFHFSKMKKALAQSQKEIDLLAVENQQLLREIEGFRTDPFYVESIARERLGLVKKGEIVYEFYGE